ncbi:MAG: M23 family metallopeptidase [Parvularculaceae bacterium]|nr:M23 family metallopeptidase [Parvularculaceae bacterium]
MSARKFQRGNIAANILVAIILIAAFILAAWFWIEKGDPSLDGAGAPPAINEPADPPSADDDAAEPELPVDEPVDEPEEPEEPPPAEPAELTDSDGNVFSYLPVGELLPSSGPGFADNTVYRPDIGFPTEDPVYLNSQVYRYGGGLGSVNGMEGGQCDARNYEYPWQDTFCEKRSRTQPMCPGGGHEGLDIRPHSCAKNVHWAVAVEDGRVIDVRRHWVTIQTADGTIYNYLHLNMGALEVTEGEDVIKGQRIGLISNDFFKSDGTRVPTTTHLHFEMYENYVAAPGEDPLFTKVNPYLTLVSAYDRKLRDE